MAANFLGLRTVIYQVSDVTEAKAWYSKVLGFPPYFDEPFYVGFNVGGFELGLIPAEKPSATSSQPGGVTTYWGVENVNKTFNELLRAGATAKENPQNVGGEIVVASVTDPWGNALGIIYNPEFKIS